MIPNNLNSFYHPLLTLGNVRTSENAPYTPLLDMLSYIPANEIALLKHLIRLEELCHYQSLIMRPECPRPQLPSVPKFQDSECESKISKKVHTQPEERPEVNVLAGSPKIEFDVEMKIESEIDKSESQVDSSNEGTIVKEEEGTIVKEEEGSNVPKELDEKTQILMQMNNVLSSRGQNGRVSLNSLLLKNGADYGTAEQKTLKKVKRLDNCLVELAMKLGIKDAAVVAYGREYLQDVIPHLIEHFNKKPFIGIAAAVLIVACYKADYPVTNAQIIKASDVKDTIVFKCFHALKEILQQKKGK